MWEIIGQEKERKEDEKGQIKMGLKGRERKRKRERVGVAQRVFDLLFDSNRTGVM